ncbi:MAG: hypothetical protein DMG40_20735 [Acidobacteria bacterium]|nr:MAG: hypothetical protein DMG40_20735 [Acidobacteriota bacterium]
MHNFAADNGSQFTGQRNTDKGACKLGTPNCEPRHDVTTFDSHGCLATITWSVDLNYKDVGTHTYHFSLKDLDPNSVARVKDNPFENAVVAETTNSEKKVAESFTPAGGKAEESKHTWVELVFDNGDNAGRFVKAFRHAIQLCGGKPSVS